MKPDPQKAILNKIQKFKEYLDNVAKHVKDGTLSKNNYTPTHGAASLLDTEVWDFLNNN